VQCSGVMTIAGMLKTRTFDFAVSVFRASKNLPRDLETREVRDQMIRASAATVANYRAACRARSGKEFISKLGTVIEESDESLFWLEFCVATELLSESIAGRLKREANELVAIFTGLSEDGPRERREAQAREEGGEASAEQHSAISIQQFMPRLLLRARCALRRTCSIRGSAGSSRAVRWSGSGSGCRRAGRGRRWRRG
jgi:four helix bundle protein